MELSGKLRAVFAMSPDSRQERELIGLIGPIIRIFCSKYQKISPTAPALPLIDWSRNKNLYLAEIGLGLTECRRPTIHLDTVRQAVNYY